jgi:peptide-methionine (S)-S-oxide reductase
MHMKSLTLAAAAVIALIATPVLFSRADAGDLNKPIPAAAQDPASTAASETAILAGGCFWGQQGVFEHVKGVTRVVAGYSGGSKDTAVYEKVGTETTGHAEAVEITFDPRQVSYATLLRIYFSVAHDPTQLNRTRAPAIAPPFSPPMPSRPRRQRPISPSSRRRMFSPRRSSRQSNR